MCTYIITMMRYVQQCIIVNIYIYIYIYIKIHAFEQCLTFHCAGVWWRRRVPVIRTTGDKHHHLLLADKLVDLLGHRLRLPGLIGVYARLAPAGRPHSPQRPVGYRGLKKKTTRGDHPRSRVCGRGLSSGCEHLRGEQLPPAAAVVDSGCSTAVAATVGRIYSMYYSMYSTYSMYCMCGVYTVDITFLTSEIYNIHVYNKQIRIIYIVYIHT